MEYKTIARRCEARFIEKKSEFIGYLCPVQTEEQAVAFIEEIRAMHRKATHNCYAYILRENNAARHSDDGEPGGTAGVPIYEVLRKEGLTDVCCVVTRYFGGVLLGAGGLVRAYTKGAKDAVDAAQIKCMAEAVKLAVTVTSSSRITCGSFSIYARKTRRNSLTSSLTCAMARFLSRRLRSSTLILLKVILHNCFSFYCADVTN